MGVVVHPTEGFFERADSVNMVQALKERDADLRRVAVDKVIRQKHSLVV